jgi:copper resistance protein B
MSKALPTRALATTLLALVSVAAQAQAQNDHAAHGQADAQTAAPSTQTVAPAADPHAGHATSASGSTAAPAMDHGNMQMQGGSAPPDARDPHGYSNGLTLGSGDYAVPGVPRLMLADEHRFFSLRGETLERRFTRKGDDSTAYDLQAWYGTTYNKAVVKAEGDIAKGKLEESRTELLWGTPSHRTGTPSSAFGWITEKGPSRQWLAFGIQGLAPTGSSWRRRATWEVADVRRCVSKAATSCC